jgi:hypothetical protein
MTLSPKLNNIQDEKVARELADFLYSQALVMMTDQIRLGDYSPIDSEVFYLCMYIYMYH